MDKAFIASGDKEIRDSIVLALRGAFEVEAYWDEIDALNAFQNNQYTCVIVDLSYPRFDGNSVLNFLISSKLIANQPVSVIMDPPNLQKELELFNSGCAEIFHKPIDPVVSLKRLQNVATISRLKKNVEQYEQKMLTDPMTGLLNKDGFQSQVRKLLKNKTPGAFLMFDLDGLKNINDTFSHQVGDLIVQEFGEHLKNAMPSSAVVCHLSGDEFCVFLKNITEHDKIAEYCEALMKLLAENVFLPDRSRTVTTSVGIAVAPEVASTYDNLLTKADHALLYVKNHGKGTYKFHAPRDDREELLKGRQEVTYAVPDEMLKKRSGEEIQTWLKFGEFRVVYFTYEKYSKETLPASLCLLNIKDKKSKQYADEKKILLLNQRITTFLKEAQYPGIFSWYSINQLMILTISREVIPQSVHHLRTELAAELDALQLELELVL